MQFGQLASIYLNIVKAKEALEKIDASICGTSVIDAKNYVSYAITEINQIEIEP